MLYIVVALDGFIDTTNFLSLNLKILSKEQFSKICTSKGYKNPVKLFTITTQLGLPKRERFLFLKKHFHSKVNLTQIKLGIDFFRKLNKPLYKGHFYE